MPSDDSDSPTTSAPRVVPHERPLPFANQPAGQVPRATAVHAEVAAAGRREGGR
ncbi:hypothetical protein [Phytohabitans kaempferiae]|uniref:Uncharacterized protein n=1 Tax=Phytohabitans kaempferiae TaxID=1620943 RepID=A0ABV6M5J6_9ACTN